MDRIVISAEGYPLTNEWLTFLENQYVSQINAIVKAIGTNAIVSGMANNGGTISNGWLVYNDELLPFESGTLDTTVVIVENEVSEGYDTAEDDSFDEVLPVWKTRVAKFGDPGDANVVDSFAYSLLNRIVTVKDLASRVQFLTSGVATIVLPETDPFYAIASGEFTNAEILAPGNSSIFTRLRVTFPEIPIDYEPLITVDTSAGNFAGQLSMTIHEKTSTSLTIDIKRFNVISGAVGFINKLNIKLIG